MLAIIAAFAWGVNSHLIKKAMVGENPMRAIGIRALFTSPLLIIPVYLLLGSEGVAIYFSQKLIFLVFFTSLLIVIGDGIFLLGLKTYDVSILLPIASIYPLFTTFILLATGVETIGLKILIGTLIVVIGVAIVTSSNGWENFSPTALFYGLGAGISWGTSIFLVRIILLNNDTEAFGLTGVRTFFMGILGFIIYFSSKDQRELQKQRSKEEKRTSLIYLALSGIVGWMIGASVFFWAVQNIGAAITTPISSINPIIASLIGIYFGIEKVNFKQFIGIITSVVGTIIIVI